MLRTLQADDAPHDRVDLFNIHVWLVVCHWIFGLVNCDTDGDDNENDCPESEETAKRDQSVRQWYRAEILVPDCQLIHYWGASH